MSKRVVLAIAALAVVLGAYLLMRGDGEEAVGDRQTATGRPAGEAHGAEVEAPRGSRELALQGSGQADPGALAPQTGLQPDPAVERPEPPVGEASPRVDRGAVPEVRELQEQLGTIPPEVQEAFENPYPEVSQQMLDELRANAAPPEAPELRWDPEAHGGIPPDELRRLEENARPPPPTPEVQAELDAFRDGLQP